MSLFFRMPTEKVHSERKRVWQRMFTKEGYVGNPGCQVPLMNTMIRIAHLVPSLEKRTTELIDCLEERQKASADGTVDFSECVLHWSHDFMVRTSTFAHTLLSPFAGSATWYSGGCTRAG